MSSNPEPEDTMHGSIYVLLKRYIETNYNYSAWIDLLSKAGISHQPYQMHEVYPTREAVAIVSAAAAMQGLSAQALLEQVGEFLVPDLLLIYKKYINPSWRTFDMLLHTETIMHNAVRREDSRTSPPILFVSKVNSNLLIIDYHSKRRMASLAIGIIKGIAAYYQESDKVRVVSITAPDAERVQIRVEFD